MNVAIPQQLEEFIHEQVRSGRYGDADAVVRDGLRLLQERTQSRVERLDELKSLVQAGLDSGVAEEFDLAALKQKARKERVARRDGI